MKELETHRLIKRIIAEDSPAITEYTLLPYAETLSDVLKGMGCTAS